MNKIKFLFIDLFNKKPFKFILKNTFGLITKCKNGFSYSIEYDNNSDFWIHKKDDEIICVDDIPNYSISIDRLLHTTNSYFFKHYSIKENDVIIDIGAGIGDDVFAIKKHNSDKKFSLYAFEAHPKTYEKLNYLVTNNSYNNVYIYQKAVVDVPKNIYISETENHSANRINENAKGYKVEGITLDNFVESNDIQTINFIKFNIEGAERDALKGMHKALSITKNIVVACHDKLAPYYNNDPHFITFDFVKNLLLEHDFTILEVEESLYHITIYASKN